MEKQPVESEGINKSGATEANKNIGERSETICVKAKAMKAKARCVQAEADCKLREVA